MHTFTPSRRGFTLIELLTVIAIIGILAAIIIHTIGAVRESAKAATCTSNLRQTTLAFMNLVNENKGRYLGRYGNTTGNNDLQVWTAALVNGGYFGIKQKDNNFEPIEVLFCPSWPDLNGENREVRQTYGLNMMNATTNPRMEGDGNRVGNNYQVNFNLVTAPSRYPLFADTYRTFNESQSYKFDDTVTGGGIHMRHKSKANVAFLDGSVKVLDNQGLANVGFTSVWLGDKRPLRQITLPDPQ